MNIRKNIDYTEMYKELDLLMLQDLTNMELYCGVGKAVCRRTEKGVRTPPIEITSTGEIEQSFRLN